MHFLNAIATAAAVCCFVSTTAASFNTSQEYYLQAVVKPHQRHHKNRFNDMFVGGYHTGAGLNDAVLVNKTLANKGFLNATASNYTQADGEPYYMQEFDLGGDFPYALLVDPVGEYAAWEPVRLDAGLGSWPNSIGAFFINSTGLQFSSAPGSIADDQYAGWLVCDWWHGVPQLFIKSAYYDIPNPSSCADINLVPQYI